MRILRPASGIRGSGDAPPDLLLAHDLRGHMLDMNEAAQRLTGFSLEQALLMSAPDFFETGSWVVVRDCIAMQAGGAPPEPCPVLLRTRDGQRVAAEFTPRLIFERGQFSVRNAGRTLVTAAGHQAAVVSRPRRPGPDLIPELRRALHVLESNPTDGLNDALGIALQAAAARGFCDAGLVVDGGGRVLACVGVDPSGADRLTSTVAAIATGMATVPDGRFAAQHLPEDRPDVHWMVTPVFAGTTLFGAAAFRCPEGRARHAAIRRALTLVCRTLSRLVVDHIARTDTRAADHSDRTRERMFEMMAENQPLEATLSQVAMMVHAREPGAVCCIMIAHDDMLRCVSAAGMSQALAHGILLPAASVREACVPCGCNFEPEVTASPVWQPAASLFSTAGTHSCLWAPLPSPDNVFRGIISLHRRSRAVPSQAECGLLQRAARIAGLAIDQASVSERLLYQARHDSLTGLANRAWFSELLQTAVDSAPSDSTTALFVLDLDRFKQVNDTLGHETGDRVLIEAAQRIRSALPPGASAARIGGDEFTIIARDLTSEREAQALGRRVLDAMRQPYFIGGYELFVTASAGASVSPRDGADFTSLLRKADLAMYKAKEHGRDNVYLFNPESHVNRLARFELENELHRVLEKRELEILYQPLVSIDGALAGFEALLTWNHPRLGRVSPREFIPIAEDAGLIVPIGAWVLQQACAAAARWRNVSAPNIRISVNVSALQFVRDDFYDVVAHTLASTGLPARGLELEITESLVLQDLESSARRMRRLRDLGVSIAVDDFGTGYSSFSYLRRLPIDTVKVDQTVLRDPKTGSGSPAIMQSVVIMAHSMGLTVVAEGIETSEDLEILRAAGCDKVQGHIFGHALTERDAERLLHTKTLPARA